MSLRITAARSAMWAGVESASLSLFSFIVLLVLAKLLSPSDFGVAAISISLIQLLCTVGELLFHDAIVRRKDLTQRQIAAAHTFSLIVGAALTLLIVLTAPSLERLFAAPHLAGVLRGMAPSILLVAGGAVPVAVLRREFRYRTVALRMVSGRLVGGLGGIACAIFGLGVWSLVVQQVATAFVALLTILILDFRSVPAIANPRYAVPLLRFGLVTLAVNLLAGGTVKVFLLACGLLLSTRDLGLVSLALRIVDTLAAIISGAQAKVALSLFSRAYHQSGSLASSYIEGARLSACVIIPLFAFLAADAHDAVLLIAGPQWAGITPLVQIMALAQIATSLMFLRGAALTAVGRPDINIITACVDLSAAILLLLALAGNGAMGAAAAWSIRIAATIPLGALLLRRHAGLGFLPILAASRQALMAAAALMLASVLVAQSLAASTVWIRLPASGLLGLLAYGLVLWLVEPGLLRQMRDLIQGVMARGGDEQLVRPST